MADGLINLTIDGTPVSVPPGTLVIEAAKQAGVLVPHYCYHPGLPVAGVCRMCLVEIEKAPKLQIACATTVTEGMVVKTQARAGNVVDLCPVGSLLSKDFLHKARAWELDKTASICTGCSQGCNITLDTRDEVVVRVRPRPNLDINRYFICDHGRMHYRWMNRGDRIEAPLVKKDGGLHATDWDEAFARVLAILRGASGKAVALVSPGASSEALAATKRLLSGFSWTGAFQVVMGEEAPLSGVPNLALRAERAPKAKGPA